VSTPNTRDALGDAVTLVNDNGVVFPGKKIAGFDATSQDPRYFIEPTDTPWFSFPESQLEAE
jgi:hypothetical protein